MTIKSKKFGPRLTVSLTSGDYDALIALAEKDRVSISWVMRRAVQNYLNDSSPAQSNQIQEKNQKAVRQ